MRCHDAREALSAVLDGEAGADDPGGPPGRGEAELVGHLWRCAACRTFSTEIARLHGALRVRVAPAIPDFVTAVLAETAARSDVDRSCRGESGAAASIVSARPSGAAPSAPA